MNVYINKADNFSDMRGPCSEGYHIATLDEWESIANAGLSMGAWDSLTSYYGPRHFVEYLKIPLGGFRSASKGAITTQDTSLFLWISSCRDSTYAFCVNGYISSSSYYIHIDNNTYTKKSDGLQIRPFKDTPVAPDSSWTTIYQGTGNAGIYWSSTLGLISISSDGTNWITIADKNLGATQVYNNGDTLSETNCGKYYQRGNNYGFDGIGGNNPTTSSTAVNAQNYGPGNYYSSSTFVTVSPWDSSNNENLRGGVSGVGGESELKNDYIGQYS